jgi:hypothetical protein
LCFAEMAERARGQAGKGNGRAWCTPLISG